MARPGRPSEERIALITRMRRRDDLAGRPIKTAAARRVLALAPDGIVTDADHGFAILKEYWEGQGSVFQVAPKVWMRQLGPSFDPAHVDVIETIVRRRKRILRYVRRCEVGEEYGPMEAIDIIQTAEGMLSMCQTAVRFSRRKTG